MSLYSEEEEVEKKWRRDTLSNAACETGLREDVLVLALAALAHLLVECEAVPEAERLVGAQAHHGLLVRRHAHAEHALRVTEQIADARHVRILPDGELVLLKAVARYQLLVGAIPQQGGHLRLHVVAVQQRAAVHVPRLDGAIECAAARRQHVRLPRTPGDRLDRRRVLAQHVQRPHSSSRLVCRCRRGRGRAGHVPDGDQVVVGAAGQVASVGVPLQAAHLLRVQAQRGHMVSRHTHVVLVYVAGARARAEHVRVPGQGADARHMRAHLPHAHHLVDVPELDDVARVAHGQHVALLYPRHRGDVVGGGGGGRRCLFATTTRRLVHGEQLRDLLGARVPDEELATERHRQVVRRRPVDQIQIEVVAQIGRVQYLVGHRLHLTHAAAGRATRSGEALLGSRDGRCGRATRGGERRRARAARARRVEHLEALGEELLVVGVLLVEVEHLVLVVARARTRVVDELALDAVGEMCRVR